MIWTALLGPITKAITGFISHRQDLTVAKRKAELKMAEAKVELDITAQKQAVKLAGADAASERAKKDTFVDEILIFGPLLLVVYTVYDPAGAAEVIQRLTEYPVWIQAIIVGIYIGVFGLRSIFAGLTKFVRSK
jgi:hypothetical protein